jgi:hypothetical protein
MKNGADENAVASNVPFTTWKLDWLKAISRDRRINHAAFRLAYFIADHINAASKATYLSDATVGEEMPGFAHRQTVWRARTLLIEAGWLEARRSRRTDAYTYRLIDKQVNAHFDLMIVRRDKRKEQRAKRPARPTPLPEWRR